MAKQLLLVIAGTVLLGLPQAAAQVCPGDCNADNEVRISELATGVGIALDRVAVSMCRAADTDGDTRVAVHELVAGVEAALFGCPPVSTPTPGPTLNDLELARALWDEHGFGNYAYTYQLSCFCVGPFLVEIDVRDGEIFSVTDPATGRLTEPGTPSIRLTIPQIFDRIERALRDDADVLRVTYDDRFGYPVDFFVDPARGLQDDELGIQVSDLRLVMPPVCRDANDCDTFDRVCVEPGGSVPCGVCVTREQECSEDSDCDAPALVCDPAGNDPCACDPSVLICRRGCNTRAGCGLGETCNPQLHCVPSRCNSDAACPDQFSCVVQAGVRTGECTRRLCADDAECTDAGVCVNGLCYDAIGTCEIVPP